MPSSAGMTPLTAWPTVSVRLRPTCPDPLASPLGNCEDFEFKSRRADSQALAATTTALPLLVFSRRVALSAYDTPLTLPELSTRSSRAITPLIMFRRPVFMAGKIMAWLELNADAVRHPRPHWP